ncbi:hypothetical protein COB18_03730 [Candidatus Kaiserbacteria bacterium]|nr:MAG: hypothetical protein COB80_02695 [Candidatus Kaiserbacteria bacterium]PCI89494.1 MAG: hypothetical protein COB18_03730 [Candidatus Kaiserbacteria bacterium]
MKKHTWITDDTDEFMLAVLELTNLAEARAFLGDVLTKSEIQDAANRWKVAKMLDFGVSYRKIERMTSISSATVSRIRRVLSDGAGGYRLMIAKLGETKNHGH